MDGQVWGEQAEHLAESLHKGDRVPVIGRWVTRVFTPTQGPNEGVEQRRLEVVVDEIGPSLAWATAVMFRTTGQSLPASGLDEAGANTASGVGVCDDGGVTDIFAGAGGTSQGAAAVVPGVELVVAANHSRTAMASHAAKFPEVAHDVADLSQVIPRRDGPACCGRQLRDRPAS